MERADLELVLAIRQHGSLAGAARALRVAAPVAFGRLHIVPRLPAFYAGHPKMKVHLQLDDGFVDLVAAGAVRKGQPVKVLGQGDIRKTHLQIHLDHRTAACREFAQPLADNIDELLLVV